MSNISKLTKRQRFILHVIDQLGSPQTKEILEQLIENFDKSSRITVIRDLNFLKDANLIKQYGKGRSVYYKTNISAFEKKFDIKEYFEVQPDNRVIKTEKLDFNLNQNWDLIFHNKELKEISDLTNRYQKRIKQYSPQQIKKELERITIEFSWKSSHIEGNTYTLLDTEKLIKEQEEAKGKTHHEALMILNHKTALEYIWDHPSEYKTVSLKKIEDVHSLVSKDLGIKKGLRKRPVGIIGTAYKPHDNIYQIKEALEFLCKLTNKSKDPFLKSLIITAGISYIQPFEDGNKRISRLMGNAVLLAHNYCPISYRSIEEIEYKKAIILFYEQHSLAFFKDLYVKQYQFAVRNYFQ